MLSPGREAPATVIDRLCALVRGKTVVALTGAGLSTESGIPDYRSPEALARPRQPHPGPRVRPVRGRAKAVLGALGAGLGANAGCAAERGAPRPRRARARGRRRSHHHAERRPAPPQGGSRNVTELHGALAEVRCLACGALEDRDTLQARILAHNPGWTPESAAFAPDGDADVPAERVERFVVPACVRCGGVLKPAVVFFGDNVPRPVVDEAFEAADAAELLLVAGTSLAVFSGYRFLRRAVERGASVAIVNRGPVRGEEHAALKIEASVGVTLEALARTLSMTSGSRPLAARPAIARQFTVAQNWVSWMPSAPPQSRTRRTRCSGTWSS